jgi:hypothetical protein
MGSMAGLVRGIRHFGHEDIEVEEGKTMAQETENNG